MPYKQYQTNTRGIGIHNQVQGVSANKFGSQSTNMKTGFSVGKINRKLFWADKKIFGGFNIGKKFHIYLMSLKEFH